MRTKRAYVATTQRNIVKFILFCLLKPRPHQQQCPSNIVQCYKLNDSFDNVECCFDIVAVFWQQCCRSRQQCRMLLRQSRTQLRQCPYCFDTVAGGVDGALSDKKTHGDRARRTHREQHTTTGTPRVTCGGEFKQLFTLRHLTTHHRFLVCRSSSLLRILASLRSSCLGRLVVLVGRVLVAVDWQRAGTRSCWVAEPRRRPVDLGHAERVGGGASTTTCHRDAGDDEYEHGDATHGERQQRGQVPAWLRPHRHLLNVALQAATAAVHRQLRGPIYKISYDELRKILRKT